MLSEWRGLAFASPSTRNLGQRSTPGRRSLRFASASSRRRLGSCGRQGCSCWRSAHGAPRSFHPRCLVKRAFAKDGFVGEIGLPTTPGPTNGGTFELLRDGRSVGTQRVEAPFPFVAIGDAPDLPLNDELQYEPQAPWQSRLQVIARVNPLTYLVDALRALLVVDAGSAIGIPLDFAVMLAVFAGLVVLAARLYPGLAR